MLTDNDILYLKERKNSEAIRDLSNQSLGGKHLADGLLGKALDNSKLFIPNAKDYLSIPTPDSTEQTVHPKVLYFEDGWNGYEFWMVHTPYAFANNTLENPCICVSSDGETWIEPAGITNPIEPKPIGVGDYNSDAHILMNGTTMECWWRAVISEETVIKRKTSIDGVNWTATETMFTTTTTGCLSPAIIHEDNTYKMWYVDVNEIKYSESADGIQWDEARLLDIEYTYDANENHAWHLDAIKTDGLVELVIYCQPEGKIHYASSLDNINFSKGVEIIRPRYYDTTWFDSNSTYRSSIVRVGEMYYIYYTGIMFDNAHHVGLIRGNNIDTLGVKESAISDTVVPSDPIGAYPENTITTHYISGEHAVANVFPEYSGGTLVTHNLKSDELGWQYQTYVTFYHKHYYLRSVEPGGTWGAWNLINTNFNGTTADRPTGARRIMGMCYYDHNLLKPIWWDGTNWRDAASVIV